MTVRHLGMDNDILHQPGASSQELDLGQVIFGMALTDYSALMKLFNIEIIGKHLFTVYICGIHILN